MSIAARPAFAARRLLPVLGWLPAYRRDWLLPDVLAGLAVWAVMVPEGMAYAGIVGRAADHGPLHDRPAVDRLRAARHLASAGRRPGHRDRPDLRADRRRHRGAGNCRVQ